MGDFLELSPPELRFRFEVRKNVPVTLSLTNSTSERVAFKVSLTVHRSSLEGSYFMIILSSDAVDGNTARPKQIR